MSILYYFKSKDGLPDAKDPLSRNLSSRSIFAANNEVAKMIDGRLSRKVLNATNGLKRISCESVVEA